MKLKHHSTIAALAGLAIAASAPTFAAGTSSPPDAKSASTLATTYADAAITTVQVEPSAIATVKLIAGAKADFQTIIVGAKGLGDSDWKTISAIDDGAVPQQMALNSGSPQGGSGSGCATTTLAAGTGSSTAAPAIGHSPVELAGLMQTDRTAVITA